MIEVGTKVILHNKMWGTVINAFGDTALGLVDSEAVITSIKGITPSHFNKFKFEVKYPSGYYYTDNERGEFAEIPEGAILERSENKKYLIVKQKE